MRYDYKIRYILVATLFAFLLSATTPFYAISKAFSQANNNEESTIASVFGEKILICTPSGFKWVNANDIENEGGKGPQSKKHKCSACLLVKKVSDDFTQQTKSANKGLIYLSSDKLTISYFSKDYSFTPLGFSTRAPPLA